MLTRLTRKPPQLMPSMLEVFGTDKPNPSHYEKNVEKIGEAVKNEAEKKHVPPPMATTVWAKTRDLGIIERNILATNTLSNVPPAPENSSAINLKEIAFPGAPERPCVTADQACLIEGYVFPAHKRKLAKKVERLVNKSQGAEDNEGNLVLSDSDESDLANSDTSSSGSFDISDYDENQVVTLSDLPLFSHLWGLFSSWITHETKLVVAGLSLPAKGKESFNASFLAEKFSKSEADAALRRAGQIRTERWNSLSLMLNRPLPHVARQLNLASDRFANRRIDAITETFRLREAIDTRNAHQWTCIATILLLVAYDIKPERSNQVKAVTTLDTSELQQLLQLFYDLRNDSDVEVDMDLTPLPSNEPDGKDLLKNEKVDDVLPASCRKCRRPKARCICQSRAENGVEGNTSATLEKMFQEALSLREEYDELLQSDIF